MIDKEDLIAIGKFQKTHALKGEINAILDIDGDILAENIPLIVNSDGILTPFYSESVRKKGSTSYLIKIQGIESEDEAKSFVNKEIYALKSMLKTFLSEEGEDLVDENSLIGYSIKNFEDGSLLGTISRIDDSTANILFHIETEDGQMIYIPLVEDWIQGIDNQNKTIEMNFPEGLIDLNKKSE